MNKATRTGIELIKTAVILGIAGNVLLRTTPLGLNVLLWILLFVTAMGALLKLRKPEYWTPNTHALHIALVFFASMFALFDSFELKLLNTAAIMLIFLVLTLPALGLDARAAGVWKYVTAGITSSLSTWFGAMVLLVFDIKWVSIPTNGLTKHLISVLRGLIIAAPIVLVIGVLLMAADAAFESVVLKTFNFDPGILIAHVVFTSLFAWLTLGYFRALIFGKLYSEENPLTIPETKIAAPGFSVTEHTTEDPDKKTTANAEQNTKTVKNDKVPLFTLPEFLKLGVIESSVILGLMNFVFLAFVIIQIPYLFGGMDLVQQTPDFKLAEYARRGVSELMTVSMLVLPILLVIHWLLKRDKPVNEKVFRYLAGAQIGLLFVIMLSAAQRLSLLTGSFGYGLTADRFYAYFVLIWLALVFVWFGMTVLRGMRHQFAYGAFWSALFILAMLHFVNPDDYIVRTNTELLKHGRSFDAQYNSSLSADAIPALIEALDFVDSDGKEIIKDRIGERNCSMSREAYFLTWNLSRSRAVSAISETVLKFGCSNKKSHL